MIGSSAKADKGARCCQVGPVLWPLGGSGHYQAHFTLASLLGQCCHSACRPSLQCVIRDYACPAVGRRGPAKALPADHGAAFWLQTWWMFLGDSPEDKVVYNSLELLKVLPPPRTCLPWLRNNKISEIKNGSFSGLSLLKTLFMIHAAPRNHVDVHDPSMLPPAAVFREAYFAVASATAGS